MTELREQAVNDALAKATHLALLTGVSVGPLVYITETGAGGPVVQDFGGVAVRESHGGARGGNVHKRRRAGAQARRSGSVRHPVGEGTDESKERPDSSSGRSFISDRCVPKGRLLEFAR